jgi:hypothetical protein
MAAAVPEIIDGFMYSLTDSLFSVAQTEHTMSTDLLTTLPQTLKLSTYFNLALYKGFLPCHVS